MRISVENNHTLHERYDKSISNSWSCNSFIMRRNNFCAPILIWFSGTRYISNLDAALTGASGKVLVSSVISLRIVTVEKRTTQRSSDICYLMFYRRLYEEKIWMCFSNCRVLSRVCTRFLVFFLFLGRVFIRVFTCLLVVFLLVS